jgi:hypothetical protein
MAEELEELFASDGIEEVPLYGPDEPLGSDRYYVLEQVDVSRVEPQLAEVQEFQGTIRQSGTHNTHYRAVESTLVQVENDFGNDTTAEVGVPATASKVRWFDAETEETASTSSVATRSAQLGDVEIYDADAAPYDAPTLLYEIDYQDEGDVDVVVWDTLGRGSKLDNDGVVQWQRAFDGGHSFDEAVLDNGLLRLRFAGPVPELTAQEWDDAAGAWSDVALGASDWELLDLDITTLAMARVDAQVRFENTSDGSEYPLNMSLKRGYPDAQWSIPENESGPIPSGLQDKLDPVADSSVVDPQEDKTLVAREEVRS